MSKVFKSINPYTNLSMGEFEIMDSNEIEQVLAFAQAEYLEWRNTDFKNKAVLFGKLADYLELNISRLSVLISNEMGKILQESVAEIEKCVGMIRYYITHAESFLESKNIETIATKSYIKHESIGPVLAIMPWNFPFWQAMRFAVPNIMAGNVIVLKHAPNVLICAKEIEKAFEVSGFPKGCLQNLIVDVDAIESIISNKNIKAVTITGSNRAGSSVASLAGKYVKKVVLELGGSDPFVVFDDADLEMASKMAVKSRFQNAGQTCIAAKRWIISSKIKNDFLELLLSKIANIKVGDPLDPSIFMGPMARPDLVKNFIEQVERIKKEPNNQILKGNIEGNCVSPFLFDNIQTDSVCFKEETFGPVANIINFDSVDEAIYLANKTKFGLGASIWTENEDLIQNIIPKIEAGNLYINSMVKSDPKLPFGGIKQSGFGREMSEIGLTEFMNVKSVWIN